MYDRITYEDRLTKIIDVVTETGRVKGRVVIIKKPYGRDMKYQEVFKDEGIADPTGGENDADDD